MNKKIGLHCIGLGNQFSNHLLDVVISAIGKGECDNILDLCDINAGQITNISDKIKSKITGAICHPYCNFYDMRKTSYKSEENEHILIISTPPETHFEYAKAGIESGYHIYVDKPFTLSYKSAQKLVDIADKKSRVIVIGSQRRFESIYCKILDKFFKFSEMNLPAASGGVS